MSEPKWDPASDDDFTRRTAFYRSAGISAKSRGENVNEAFRRSFPTIDRKDLPAAYAGRLLSSRSSGSWVTDRVEQARHDYEHPDPMAGGKPESSCSTCGEPRTPLY